MTQQALIDRLLYEEEGATLDFKSEQYKFAGASDDEKSELLKDIVAFANAWRRTDAYILVGAKEVKGGRSIVTGIAEHLDDAHLQQFVNAKVNRPIEFSYRTIEFEGVKVGLFQMPTQKRPFHLKKDFGKLKSNTVYIRRGSSTDTASLDEVASMGAEMPSEQARKPVLETFLVHGKHDEFQQRHVKTQTINATIPSDHDIPDYGSKYQSIGGMHAIPSLDLYINHDFYREKAKYMAAISKVKGFKIGAHNSGSLSAKDVKVILEIEGDPEELIVCERQKLPDSPDSNRTFVGAGFLGKNTTPDIKVQKTISGWRVTCTLGKIQPQELISTFDRIYVGAENSRTIKIDVKIYCDDLPGPVSDSFEIALDVIHRTVSVEELIPSNA
jgi:hypothetical protein